MTYSFFFFFQAEDGIRDSSVTGVQTCALPILPLYKYLGPYKANLLPVPMANIINGGADRKSTRLNSSHTCISYAVFCLTKSYKSSGVSNPARVAIGEPPYRAHLAVS